MVEIKKSTRPNKKYMSKTPSGKWVHWGSSSDEHYKDTTGLGIWSHKDHLDKERRKNYRARHEAIKTKDGKPAYKDKEQPSYYSYNFLW